MHLLIWPDHDTCIICRSEPVCALISVIYTRRSTWLTRHHDEKIAVLKKSRSNLGSGNVARGEFESLICTSARCDWISPFIRTPKMGSAPKIYISFHFTHYYSNGNFSRRLWGRSGNERMNEILLSFGFEEEKKKIRSSIKKPLTTLPPASGHGEIAEYACKCVRPMRKEHFVWMNEWKFTVLRVRGKN